MYKIIHKNKVITITKNLQFYTKNNNFFIPCDESIATYVCVNNSMYCLKEYLSSNTCLFIQYKVINSSEFESLKRSLKNNTSIYDPEFLLPIKEAKIEELRNKCQEIITKGIQVILSDNKAYNFELSIEDQLNLRMIESSIISSDKNSFAYHAKGDLIKMYSRADMQLIINKANDHITENTTYFNLVKNCINNMNDLEKIQSFTYGEPIPNLKYNKLLKLTRI